MLTKQNKYFCATFAFSLMVHLFALTLLFTIPKTDAPEGYKRVRVKLGAGKVKMSDELTNARKYAEYEPGAGLTDRKAIEGNSDRNAKAIPAQASDVAPPNKADDAVKESLKNMILNQKNSTPTKNIATDKKDEPVLAPKSQPLEVKKVEEQVAKKEAASQPNSEPDAAESQEGDDEGMLIGNSIAPDAEESKSYVKLLPNWLEKFKKYPEEAKIQRASAIGEIFIKIDRNGKVLLYKILKSTGNEDLDKAMIKMIIDANPVIPVPPEYYPDKKTFSYKIPITFERPSSDQ